MQRQSTKCHLLWQRQKKRCKNCHKEGDQKIHQSFFERNKNFHANTTGSPALINKQTNRRLSEIASLQFRRVPKSFEYKNARYD